MAITAGEFDSLHLTTAEFDMLGLTAGEFDKLTVDNLLKIARLRLERFSPATPSAEQSAPLKDAVGAVLLNIGSAMAYDTLKNIDWSDALRKIITLLS